MSDTFEVEVDPLLKPNYVLRRYVDLPKYLDLLRTKALYFRRADKFTDRFEGALTPAMRRLLNATGADIQGIETADAYYRRAREGTYVSCWSRGLHDNMALWQLYGGVNSSLAVTTTVKQLIEVAATWPDETIIKKVEYIDHFKNPDMILGGYTDPLKFKHLAYSYEDEVRVLVSRHRGEWTKNPVDFRLPIPDLNSFIRSIVVAPEAEAWFYELVEEVTRLFGVTKPVNRSKLTMLPM